MFTNATVACFPPPRSITMNLQAVSSLWESRFGERITSVEAGLLRAQNGKQVISLPDLVDCLGQLSL